MKNVKLLLISIVLLTAILSNQITFGQQNSKSKFARKVPKISIALSGGFSYVFSSANGEVRDFSSWYNPDGGNIFNSKNLGMQQGYGLNVTGKYAANKTKKFRLTGELGYIHFYNSEDKGMNRTRWNIFNLGAGVEYNFSPKEKESMFIGYALNYNLMFGAWQSDITYPDNYISNIYTKFKPASRLGMSATAGMQFPLTKKTDMIISIRGVWANIFPKQNYYSDEVFQSYINDSGNNNGIELESKKDIIYLQITAGIVLPLKY